MSWLARDADRPSIPIRAAGLRRGERRELLPELDHLGGGGLRAPVLGGSRGQLGLEEPRLAPCLEVPEGERALDLPLEIVRTVEVDDRKLVAAALGEQRPVVGEPQLLPGRGGE